MKAIIFPSKINGVITAPPSKSYTHRAIILASLADGTSRLKNALLSVDTELTLSACRALGAEINVKNNIIEINGIGGHFPKKEGPVNINCGLSGTTIRLLTAISILSPNEVILSGERRLKERPMGELVRVLKSQGINITAAKKGQFPPVAIKGGRLKGKKIIISGEISSQFISALLLIAPFAENETEIIAQNLKSAPYIDITLDLMKTFGVNITRKGNIFRIKNDQEYKARDYTIEGDYSSASYFFAAGALSGKIKITGLNSNSVQGDKCFLEILDSFKKHREKRCFDLGNFPDIVPTAAMVAASQKGTTIIENIGHLRTKETDRIAALASELKKMGTDVTEKKDSLIIKGGKLKGAEINTYDDHRIAMSFAIAGLFASGKTIINNAEVVSKSYPGFWKDLKSVGANISIIN